MVGAGSTSELVKTGQSEGGKNVGLVSSVSGVESDLRTTEVGLVHGVVVNASVPVSGETSSNVFIHSTSVLEEAAGINESTSASSGVGATESVDGIGERIDGIGVVEGLGAKDLEQGGVAKKRRAIINVLVRLNNPDQFLYWVVKIKLDFVTGRADRFITSELKLGDQIFVGILGESSAFVSVQEDIVNVQRCGNQRLVVCDGGSDGGSNISLVHWEVGQSLSGVATEGSDSPQALINGAKIEVDLDLVVLESNQRKSKTGVGAKPELERHVKGGLGKGVTGSAHLTGSSGITRPINISERGIGDEGELSGVSNHLEITALLFGGHGKLIPDVHPVTILTVNALTTDFNLHLSDKLFAGEIQPTGIDTVLSGADRRSVSHKLVDLGKSDLEVGAVSKITVSADNAGHTAPKIGLSVESLFDRFDSKVCVASVGHFPESNLRIASKVYVLRAISD